MDVINLVIKLQNKNCIANGLDMKEIIMENERHATETTGVNAGQLDRLKACKIELKEALDAGDLFKWKGKIGLSRTFVKGV